MAAKVFFVFCAQALLAQLAFSQIIGRNAGCSCSRARSYDGLGRDYGYDAAFAPAISTVAPLAGVAPASGGGLSVTSSSSISPTGLSVASENAIEGILAVVGDLPLVSAVNLEGALPTAGAGSIMYGCGDGSISIVSESSVPALDLADGLAGLAAPIKELTAARSLNVPACGLSAPARSLAPPARSLAPSARSLPAYNLTPSLRTAAPSFGRRGCGTY